HTYNTSADFPLMMNEWLAAQRRVAPEINLSEAEIERIHKKIKFFCVADFIRRGRKKEAFKLFRENLGGAVSPMEIGKTFFRFFAPTALLRRRQRASQRATSKKYGKLIY
ncbi:hypothetical protein, partial [Clavibacter michiganensis]|uniref:hypothetical protein n=1 Tax=Clavibacter michiganensis TaxID=28447 RepID=UPI002930D320